MAKVNNEKSTWSAATQKPTPQTEFTEDCIRQGWRIADVQMWQNLCKKLALLQDDSEISMMLLLGIADEHDISPIQLAAYARDEGYKQLDEEAAFHLAQMYGVSLDAEAEDDEGAVTKDDESDDEPKGWRKKKRVEASQFADTNSSDVGEE